MLDRWMENKRMKEATTYLQAHLSYPLFPLPRIGNSISFSESHELLGKK